MTARDSLVTSTTWRQRWTALLGVGPLLRIAWDLSPALLVVTIATRVVRAFLPLAILWIWKLVLDGVMMFLAGRNNGPDVFEQVWHLIAIECGLAIVSDAATRLNAFCVGVLGERLNNRVTTQLMEHADKLELGAFEDPVFLDKLERARRHSTNQVSLISSLLNTGQDALSLVIFSIAFAHLSPWLMLLLAVAAVPACVGEIHFARETYSLLYKRTSDRRHLEYLRFLGTSAQAVKEAKLYRLGKYFVDRYTAMARSIEDEHEQIARRRALVGWALSTLATAGYFGAYVLIVREAFQEGATIGTIVFATRAFSRSRGYIERIAATLTDVAEDVLHLHGLFECLETAPAAPRPASPVRIPAAIRHGFELRNVSFCYPGSSRLVLKNINLRIRSGERVAFVGENGAGKTTLIKLLTRLYDPSDGRILLDGVDLREYEPDELRRTIGVVFQDFMRYDLTVRENIGFGDLTALDDQARLDLASRKSLASQVVGRMPAGYDQVVGRRFHGGVDLSGGEWQKLALARAYLRDAQILIMDEPTAGLDPRTEAHVFRRFAELAVGRTVVLISHRFSTVRVADRIVVLGDGSIQEDGTHDQLLGRSGRYANLFELQAAGYR